MTAVASLAARALAAGAVCLTILGGMMVGHVWPLWRGQSIRLPVTAIHSVRPVDGEQLRVETAATRLFVSDDANATVPEGSVKVRPAADWPRNLDDDTRERYRRLRGRLVYVQFEPRAGAATGEYHPVSVSLRPVDNAVNIRGRIRPLASTYHVRLDADAYYGKEGTASQVEGAIKSGRKVELDVAVAASGRTRIRRLLIDGTPLPQ